VMFSLMDITLALPTTTTTTTIGPFLSGIRAKSCLDDDAGTSDNVRVHFRNSNNERCVTNWVTDGDPHPWPKQAWPQDHLKNWTTPEKFGECATSSFQPSEFRLELEPYGLHTWFNDIKLCYFEADFGSSSWEWSAAEEDHGVWTSKSAEDSTTKRRFTEWTQLSRHTDVSLRAIQAKSCEDKYSGTSDNVRVHFRNSNNERCITNWVTDGEPHPWPKQAWPENQLKNWTTPEKFGACRSENPSFQPIDGLEFRLELEPYGGLTWFNDVKLCYFEADFGSSSWEWSAAEEDHGVWTSKSTEDSTRKRRFTEWTQLSRHTDVGA